MFRLILHGCVISLGSYALNAANGAGQQGQSASVASHVADQVPVQPFLVGGREVSTAEEYADARLVCSMGCNVV